MNAKTWGAVYRHHLAKGEDHGGAAFAADQYEKRKKWMRDMLCIALDALVKEETEEMRGRQAEVYDRHVRIIESLQAQLGQR